MSAAAARRGGGSVVVVTRPAAQAGGWIERLGAAGIDGVALPLIAIAPALDADAVTAAWRSLPLRRLVVFVSANAVLHFFAARSAGSTWPHGLLAATPGPGTADALRAAGVDAADVIEPAADADSFDSESLWRELRERDWRGAEVLVVRGDGGRDWLAERLVEAGARVEAVSAYRRLVPVLAIDERAALDSLLDGGDPIWLFSSSQAIDHLEQLAGRGRCGAARAVATHARIAARARQAGFGSVVEAASGFDALVACIQSMRP